MKIQLIRLRTEQTVAFKEEMQVGGAIVVIDNETHHNELAFLYERSLSGRVQTSLALLSLLRHFIVGSEVKVHFSNQAHQVIPGDLLVLWECRLIELLLSQTCAKVAKNCETNK